MCMISSAQPDSIHGGGSVIHEGWSSYDNLSRSSCDNCHGVRRKTIVNTAKTLVKDGNFHL
jgi:hypothetical protein